MANSVIGTRSPNGNVGVNGVVDSAELSMLTPGALSGFALSAGSGMTVQAGGTPGVQDVAVVRNTAGGSDALVGNGAAVSFDIGAAPATSGQTRVDALVVWKDSTLVTSENNGYDTVGYQTVAGQAATTGSQVAPSDSDIRAAIPNGAAAFYAVIGYVSVPYGAVEASSTVISGVISQLGFEHMEGGADISLTLDEWRAFSAIDTSFPGASAASGWSVNISFVQRRYGRAFINGSVTPNHAVAAGNISNETMFTLPAGFRPPNTLVGVIAEVDGVFSISGGGVVTLTCLGVAMAANTARAIRIEMPIA